MRETFTIAAQVVGRLVLAVIAALCLQAAVAAVDTPSAPAKLTADDLGKLVVAVLGGEPLRDAGRFSFECVVKIEETDDSKTFQATTVLSNDESHVWFVVWLDPLPERAADVPKNALLRMLATNDVIGPRCSFAYIGAAKRFVIQAAIPNQHVTRESFDAALQEVLQTAVKTQPVWDTEQWGVK